MNNIDKIALIEIQNGQILSTRSKGKDTYYFPGGKRDPGETDAQTLVREIEEEMDVHIDENTIDYVGTFEAQADGKKEGVIVKMTCYRAKFHGELTPKNEIEEIRWLNYKDLDIVSAVDKKIFKFLKERSEIE